ncbi:MAG: hypothetical protein LH610_06445 [Sphingomonas bacterium]|nr:hypothetical protein [Sphingomonas bacterium]
MRVRKIVFPLAAFPLLLAAAPQPLEPNGKWLIDYGAQRCTLWRKFGDGNSSVRLHFEQTAPRGSIAVLISGRALRSGNGRRDNKLEFQALGGVFLDHGLSVVTSQEKEEAVYWANGFSRGKWGLVSDDVALQLAKALSTGKGTGRPFRATSRVKLGGKIGIGALTIAPYATLMTERLMNARRRSERWRLIQESAARSSCAQAR